jgi:hypothetical protein
VARNDIIIRYSTFWAFIFIFSYFYSGYAEAFLACFASEGASRLPLRLVMK